MSIKVFHCRLPILAILCLHLTSEYFCGVVPYPVGSKAPFTVITGINNGWNIHVTRPTGYVHSMINEDC